MGGELKSDADKVADQSIRFSRKTKYKWTEAKIRKWIQDHGYSLKDLTKLKGVKIFDYYNEQKPFKFNIISRSFKVRQHEEGKPLIIEGIINSSSIDAYNEIVSPDAVMKSVEFYKKFPTVRWMHGPEPIGKTLKIWREGDFVKARIEIDADETKVISKILKGTVKSFSIGFMALAWDRFCPNKGVCVRRFTDILLIEISPVDSPANRDAEMTSVTWKSPLNLNDYYFENTEGKLESLNLKDGDFHTTHLSDTDWTLVDGEWYDSVKISRSIKSKRGNRMAKEEIEVLEPVDEEEEKPSTETVAEEIPSTEESSQKEDGTEKILKAIGALSVTVEANRKELERMKMTEEERKSAEAMDNKVQENLKSINEKMVALEKEKQELQKKLEIKEEVERQLEEKEKNLPPVRSTMSINEQAKAVGDALETDVEAAGVLARYMT